MGDIIQFPVKAKPVTTIPGLETTSPELNERIAKLRNAVETMARGFINQTYSLVFFVTNAQDVEETAENIKLLEERVIVVSLHRLSIQKRWNRYRYPTCHVMVMSHQIFRKDRKELEELATLNKVLLIVEEKTGKLRISKFHTKKDYEDWKKNKK
jgi:hypothetical protein